MSELVRFVSINRKMSTAVHISLEEFIARPEQDDDWREELIEGEVIVSPGAKYWQADIVERLRERLAPLKQRGISNRNLQQKAALYLQHGAEQVWIVHRKTETVTVLIPGATAEARVGEALDFHGVSVPVGSIFVRSENS